MTDSFDAQSKTLLLYPLSVMAFVRLLGNVGKIGNILADSTSSRVATCSVTPLALSGCPCVCLLLLETDDLLTNVYCLQSILQRRNFQI